MNAKGWRSVIILLGMVFILSGWAVAQVSESTRIYASLPALIEITIPSQYKDLQMDGCEPGKSISVAGQIEVKSNSNWGLTVAGSTSSGCMVGSSGSPVHELHTPMTVSSQSLVVDPVAIPGTASDPPAATLQSNIDAGDYSGVDAIDLAYEQFFGWNDPADANYQITVTLTATPA
jgi:hypothetical protein